MMKNIIYLVILLLLFGCADEATQSDEFSLRMMLPEDEIINQGDTVQMGIMIEECSQPIFGMSLQLEYSLDVLAFVDTTSVIAGDYLGENCIIFAGEEDGIIHLTVSLVQGDALIDGTGTLCFLNFSAVNVGEAAINLLSDSISVYDADGNELEIEFLETDNTIISVI